MIDVSLLRKIYGHKTVLFDISFKVKKNEVVALLGPSGSGKSTVLRCINGIEQYDSGHIKIYDTKRSKIATIFQNFNLFENKTVLENLCYAQMKVHKRQRASAEEKAYAMLDRVKMDRFHAASYPCQLSGGQKQRVAIARSLCVDPDVVLFDEPTSALDPENVKEILSLIKSLADHSTTMLVVTHELSFARAIADRILFFADGRLIEDCAAEEFWQQPKTDNACKFIDHLNR